MGEQASLAFAMEKRCLNIEKDDFDQPMTCEWPVH